MQDTSASAERRTFGLLERNVEPLPAYTRVTRFLPSKVCSWILNIKVHPCISPSIHSSSQYIGQSPVSIGSSRPHNVR